MRSWVKPLVRKPSLTCPDTHELMAPIRAPPPPVVGGTTVVVVVVVVEARVVDVLELLLVLDVEEVELVGVVDDEELVDTWPVVRVNWPPGVVVLLVVHTTRVALSPAVPAGRGAVEPVNAPPGVEMKGVELTTVPEVSGVSKTSKDPSLAPVPSGQPAPTNRIDVPAGPLVGWNW